MVSANTRLYVEQSNVIEQMWIQLGIKPCELTAAKKSPQ